MMEDELIKIWQSSPKVEQVKFEKSRLMLDLQSSLNRLQRSWKFMELREIIVALIVIPFFIHRAYIADEILIKIGSIWIVLSGIYIITRLTSVKKYKPNISKETYLDYLFKSKEYLSIQKKLLSTVLYWYFLPCAIGILLVFVGSIENMQKLSLNILGLIGLGAIIYFLNKRAVKKTIQPRLEKIDELIKVMEE
jgi:uncharacterized membrane protein